MMDTYLVFALRGCHGRPLPPRRCS